MRKFSTRAEHDTFYANQLKRERLIARVNKLVPVEDRWLQVYRAVDVLAVPDFLTVAARQMLDYCIAKLNGLELKIAWLERVEKRKCERPAFIDEYPTAGRQSNSLLWVRCDMPLEEILFTIAHEAHHYWYSRGPGRKFPYKTHKEMWEAGADAFAFRAMSELRDFHEDGAKLMALRGQAEALSATRQRAPRAGCL
jgi:hypothetical protein